MGEIWIPELIIVLFLLLSVGRPFFKGLRAMDGLVWLSVVCFLLALCLFPAYGFRPECIPLLIFTFLLNIAHIPLLAESILSDSAENDHSQSFVLPVIELILLFAALVPLFLWAPKIPLELLTEGVQTRTIHNETENYDYFLRFYYPTSLQDGLNLPDGNRLRPIIFVAPPEAGSVSATDRICVAFRDQGFMTISYSRRGFDFPAAEGNRKYYVSPRRINMMWQAFLNGTEHSKANDGGKFLESERLKDIEFLLPFICRNQDDAASEAPVFIAAYGAAGSAAAFLFEQPGFSSRYRNVKGIAAIESRLWSSYQAESPRVLQPRWLPQPAIPVLYLVSDKAFDEGSPKSIKKNRLNPYQAVLDTFKNSSGHAVLAAFEGAGPYAYSDFSLTHPIYLFLYPGQMKNTTQNANTVEDTAGFAGNFFLSLLEQNNNLIMPDKRKVSSAVLLELRNEPAF